MLTGPRILLVNDTSSESNPGCRAASTAITRMLSTRGQIAVKLPLGYGADFFKAVPGVRRRCVLKRDGFFNTYDELVTEVEIDCWRRAAEEAFGAGQEFAEALAQVDEVFVNAEGSVHHNFPRALSVLALCRQSALAGKPLYVLNASLMAMDSGLLNESLAGAALIHLRESLSADYLRSQIPDAATLCVPDLAFAGAGMRAQTAQQINPKGILVTPGVLGTPKQLGFMLEQLCRYPEPLRFLGIGDNAEAEEFRDLCAGFSVEMIPAGALSISDLLQLLRSHKLVVSGRHHINIFCMIAGVPFIPLPSNSWKIEGTLRDVGAGSVCVSHDEFVEKLASAAANDFKIPRCASSAVDVAAEKVNYFTESVSRGSSDTV